MYGHDEERTRTGAGVTANPLQAQLQGEPMISLENTDKAVPILQKKLGGRRADSRR